MTPDAALAICRFLHIGAAAVLWGAFLFLWTLVPAGLADPIGRRLWGPRVVAIGAAVATSMATLPLETAAIGEGWPDAMDPAMLRAVLFETSVGRAAAAQALAALSLAATLALPARMRSAGVALAAGVLLAAQAASGHAAMHEGTLGVVHRLTDALHALTGGAWLGALLPLLPLLQALENGPQRREAAIALRRFSLAGHFAVAIVILTGVANTMLVLDRWPTDLSSPYQAMLAGKIALVLVMTALALVNRYGVVPRLARARRDALHALRLATLAELCLGLMVIALVSAFGLLEPI